MASHSKAVLSYLVSTVWRYAQGIKTGIAATYVMFFLANIAAALQPIALGRLIDVARTGGLTDLHQAVTWTLIYGGLILVFWCLHGPARVIERNLAFTVYRRFVVDLYNKVTEMPLRWHQDHHSGSTINRVNKAGRSLSIFAQNQYFVIQIFTRLTGSLLLLFLYSTWVAVVSIVASCLIAWISKKLDDILRPLIRETNEKENSLSGALYDYIGNIVTILTLRLQGNAADEIGHRFDKMRPSFYRVALVNEYKWAAMSILLMLAQCGIIGAYVVLSMRSGAGVAVGSAVAIFQYLLTINMQFYQGMNLYGEILTQSTDVHGIDGLIEDYARLVTGQNKVERRSWQSINIRDLRFTHHEGEDVLHHLQGVDLSLRAGQKMALIGSSGSGKTTLLTLLRGLYDAQRVTLEIDGARFPSLQPLSAFTTLVPQDTEIFENTLRYNITLGTEVDEARLQQVIRIAQLAPVIEKTPHGLDTDIRERGVNLSGGQKQRLALARGILAAWDSSLLLLDEPTSNVDLFTESEILGALFDAYTDKAIVMSLHRLHLLPRFDRIGLMRDGVMIEQGGFDELIARQGAFYQLWQSHLEQNKEAVA